MNRSKFLRQTSQVPCATCAALETAPGRHLPVERVETIRRSGKTCHRVAHLS